MFQVYADGLHSETFTTDNEANAYVEAVKMSLKHRCMVSVAEYNPDDSLFRVVKVHATTK